MYEAPMATAGGISLLVTAAVAGDLIADALDRFIAGYDPAESPAPTLPAPYTVDNPIPKWNNDSQAMQPGIWRIVAQGALALFTFGAGAIVGSPALKFFFYGLGTGASIHLGSQILTAYVITPMVKSSTGTGARMYQHEINVLNGLANPSGGILGKPPQVVGRVGAPPQLPANQPGGRVPVSLASVATQPPTNSAAAPDAQPRANMGQPPAGGCAPCDKANQPAPQLAPASQHPLWSVLLERPGALAA